MLFGDSVANPHPTKCLVLFEWTLSCLFLIQWQLKQCYFRNRLKKRTASIFEREIDAQKTVREKLIFPPFFLRRFCVLKLYKRLVKQVVFKVKTNKNKNVYWLINILLKRFNKQFNKLKWFVTFEIWSHCVADDIKQLILYWIWKGVWRHIWKTPH